MTRAVTVALLLALSLLAVCSAQRRRFNFNFQPSPPRMPAKDFKVVCRPKNWDLSIVTPRELGCALRAAAKLTNATAVEEDLVRVNERNNTMTVSTPCMNRSGPYANVKTLQLGGRDLAVSAYVAAPENSVRGVIYNAYNGCPLAEIRAGFLKRNEDMEILDAKPLGKSKAIQITFGGKRVPRQVIYWNCLYAVISYRELVETCYNCRRVGHRADVCYRPKTNLCRRCGKEHPAPPEGESLTCTPDCIVCHGAHSTGSRNCKFRLARQQPTGLQQSNEDKSQTGKEERRSRPRKRSSSGVRGDSKSRDRSASFPPLPGPEPGKGGGQGSGHGRSPSATRKKHRFNVEAEGGARGRRNFNVGGSVRGEYDLYRGRDGTRVVALGGLAYGATRVDGTTYKGRPQAGVGIAVEIPIGKGR